MFVYARMNVRPTCCKGTGFRKAAEARTHSVQALPRNSPPSRFLSSRASVHTPAAKFATRYPPNKRSSLQYSLLQRRFRQRANAASQVSKTISPPSPLSATTTPCRAINLVPCGQNSWS